VEVEDGSGAFTSLEQLERLLAVGTIAEFATAMAALCYFVVVEESGQLTEAVGAEA